MRLKTFLLAQFKYFLIGTSDTKMWDLSVYTPFGIYHTAPTTTRMYSYNKEHCRVRLSKGLDIAIESSILKYSVHHSLLIIKSTHV